MKKTFVFVLCLISGVSSAQSKVLLDDVADKYAFHPHYIQGFPAERSSLGFDVSKELHIKNQDIHFEVNLDVEESTFEQEVHGFVEFSTHNSLIDLHLKAVLDTGFFYKNDIEAEVGFGKTIHLLKNIDLSPEVNFLKVGDEIESGVLIRFSKST